MSEYAIEKGIPISAKFRDGRKESKYPFRAMEVGDSFFMPARDGQSSAKLSSSLSSQMASLAPKRFTRRSVDGGVRVWRIA